MFTDLHFRGIHLPDCLFPAYQPDFSMPDGDVFGIVGQFPQAASIKTETVPSVTHEDTSGHARISYKE
jgi:hypothetical protein